MTEHQIWLSIYTQLFVGQCRETTEFKKAATLAMEGANAATSEIRGLFPNSGASGEDEDEIVFTLPALLDAFQAWSDLGNAIQQQARTVLLEEEDDDINPRAIEIAARDLEETCPEIAATLRQWLSRS